MLDHFALWLLNHKHLTEHFDVYKCDLLNSHIYSLKFQKKHKMDSFILPGV